MVATAIYSLTMVLWKETAIFLRGAMEMCELNGHLMPSTSSLSNGGRRCVLAGA